jgi:beta-glucanase (GH16 family)
VGLAFCNHHPYHEAKQQYQIPVTGYELFWQDEFNGNRLDASKWDYRIGKRRDAYNVTETVFTDGNGLLHLQVKKDGSRTLTSMISTQHLFETKYGYFECRAKLTNATGIWPAFWLQSSRNTDYGTPEKNGVEIDIFEYFPNLNRNAVAHGLHWGGYGVTHKESGQMYSPLQPTADGFHVFGLEWTDSSYTAFVDGKQTIKGTQFISKVEQFIILSTECDEKVAGPLQTNALPDAFIVDYVRVFKKKP